MPVYQYECVACFLVVDQYFKRVHELTHEYYWCRQCEAQTLHKRIISASSFQLKGKGWAKDGYVNPTPGMPSGQKFIDRYRKELADPEHPRKVGDLLRDIGRGKSDDLTDIGCSIRDLDADRHNKLHKGNEANLVRPKPTVDADSGDGVVSSD
jgi:putative FmdB family regulatory protein